jgi:hypothetical protein
MLLVAANKVEGYRRLYTQDAAGPNPSSPDSIDDLLRSLRNVITADGGKNLKACRSLSFRFSARISCSEIRS